MFRKLCQEKKIPWPESASKLFRPSDRHLSAKLVSTFAEKGCHVVSVTDTYGRILGFLDQSYAKQVMPSACKNDARGSLHKVSIIATQF
jgi:CBS-domain-containing membrane protein